ncbi:RNA exonuclease 3 [[Candida] anglica]|uniref:RNA exonuclease 3 n=1 Tax=[Candida] anglica TaxID=148631 RepID=A0ABP0E8X0_9ASCO
MFKLGDGYFSQIKCPNVSGNSQCNIINCIFKHDNSKKRSLDESVEVSSNKRSDNTTKTSEVKDITILLPKAVSHISVSRSERTQITRKIADHFRKESKTPNKDAIDKEYELCCSSKSIEEYNTNVANYIKSISAPELKDPRFILPKEMKSGAPAMIQVRKKFIQSIVDVYKQVTPELKTPILRAIKDEYGIATKTTGNTYGPTIKRFVYDLKRNGGTIKTEPLNATKDLSDSELLSRLEKIVISKDVLTKFGYIMDTPETIKPEQNRTCRRCNISFKLKDQMIPTKCIYHSGRNKKKDKHVRAWTCCGGIVGDCDECSTCEHHVFYWSNAEEMHSAIPFTHTNTLTVNKNAFKALGIDCEMGFTTLGFELLRTTVVDFLSGEEVLDILVRPKGTIIDLNTKWSGVAEIKEEAVSFEDHLMMLNEVMDKNTILIGHGLENDMNAMRIIHDRIVDTAILYPKHQTSPQMRFSLKHLCFTYLGRTIQEGEHDSGEDSLGAIDVVKYFLKK